MSNRITQKDLEWLVKIINNRAKSPQEPYNEARQANIGNYHLDYAYGGVKLVRMCNEHGGIRTISSGGYGTKRELYNWMEAFLYGLDEKD